jgi:hypothetical protein
VPGANIHNKGELDIALSNAAGVGGHFILAPGDYGTLSIPSGVTIESADPANKFQFTKSILKNKSDIHIKAAHYVYTPQTGDAPDENNLYMQGCSDCSITHSVLEGKMRAGVGIGRGLRLWGVNTNILIEGNEVFGFLRGLGLNGNNVVARYNDIHTIRSDGINTGVGSNYLIERNYMHDFGTLGGANDHRDMIQAIGSATGITIRDNFFDHGVMAHALYTQCIHSDNHNPDSDVTVTDNVMIMSHTRALPWANFSNGIVERNEIVQWLDANGNPRPDNNPGVAVPKIILQGSLSSFEDNIAPSILKPATHPASNLISSGDPTATRAAAAVDPRWSRFNIRTVWE